MSKNIPKQYISNFDTNKLQKKRTINGNLKTDVLKKFSKGMSDRNITNTINAAIELHCSGDFDSVLSKLVNFYFNEINISALNGINYIHNLTNYYRKYSCKVKKTNPLDIVNDQVIRNFICFFSILTITNTQRKLIKLPKIKPKDFNLGASKKNLISKNLKSVNTFLNEGDPKEIIIPLSEICNYFKNDSGDISDREHKIIYWISWLFEYEKIYHKNSLVVSERQVAGIDKKFHKDFIWIIWTIVKYYSNEHQKNYICKLFDLYTHNFTKGTKRSRCNLLITAVTIIVNPFPKILYPVEPIKLELYKNAALYELRCNEYYLKLFQNKIYESVNTPTNFQ